jgi:hypothetical protein
LDFNCILFVTSRSLIWIVFLTVSRGPLASYTNRLIFPTGHTMYRHGCRPAASSRNVDSIHSLITQRSRHTWSSARAMAWSEHGGGRLPRGQEIYPRAVSLSSEILPHTFWTLTDKIANSSNIDTYQSQVLGVLSIKSINLRINQLLCFPTRRNQTIFVDAIIIVG